MRAGLPLLLALAACQQESPEAPRSALAPQPIGYPDIEANGLHGPNCAYASGRSMAPVVMAFGDYAVMKLDGHLVRFTLDPQCKEVRSGTGSRYLAEGRTLDLAVNGDAPRFEGSIKLSDGEGAVLYAASGAAQCSE